MECDFTLSTLYNILEIVNQHFKNNEIYAGLVELFNLSVFLRHVNSPTTQCRREVLKVLDTFVFTQNSSFKKCVLAVNVEQLEMVLKMEITELHNTLNLQSRNCSRSDYIFGNCPTWCHLELHNVGISEHVENVVDFNKPP